MGFLKRVILDLLSVWRQAQVYESEKNYTPEEYVIHEQEQSGESWHGVPLSELSKLAQQTYRGRYVTVDKYGFLVFCYSSKSRKTKLNAQCKIDENGFLTRLSHGYYYGQWKDLADEFVEKVNRQFTFR